MSNIQPISPALLALLNGESNSITPFTREIFLLSVTIAGTTHIPNIKDLEPFIEKDVVLQMMRDPDNKYDSSAIGIYLNKQLIGFVPMELNEIIARLMDAGKAFICRVTSKKWKGNWLRIKADISMVE